MLDLPSPFDDTPTDQYKRGKDADLICDWLYTLLGMTFVWILVTLISDWKSVFYRKAAIYKRMEQEEAKRHEQQAAKSFVSETASSYRFKQQKLPYDDTKQQLLLEREQAL
jgi:hypothetical protein